MQKASRIAVDCRLIVGGKAARLRLCAESRRAAFQQCRLSTGKGTSSEPVLALP